MSVVAQKRVYFVFLLLCPIFFKYCISCNDLTANTAQDIESIITNTEYYYITTHSTPRKQKVCPADIIRSDFSMEIEDIPDFCFGSDYFAFHDVSIALHWLFYVVQGDEDAVERVCCRISQLPTSVALHDIITSLPEDVMSYAITTQPKNSNSASSITQHTTHPTLSIGSAVTSSLSVISSNASTSVSLTAATPSSSILPSLLQSNPTSPPSIASETRNNLPKPSDPIASRPIASIRAIRRDGATIRSGPDIDNSSVIDRWLRTYCVFYALYVDSIAMHIIILLCNSNAYRLQFNEVACVLSSHLLKPTDIDCVPVTRIHIQFEVHMS